MVVERAAHAPVYTDAVQHAARQAAVHAARERIARGDGVGRWSARAADEGAGPVPSPVLVDLLAHLRATVTTYVDGRRSAGVPVQCVLPEVKTLVRGALSDAAARDAAETLLPEVVRWSIEAYFARDYAAWPRDARGAAPR